MEETSTRMDQLVKAQKKSKISERRKLAKKQRKENTRKRMLGIQPDYTKGPDFANPHGANPTYTSIPPPEVQMQLSGGTAWQGKDFISMILV